MLFIGNHRLVAVAVSVSAGARRSLEVTPKVTVAGLVAAHTTVLRAAHDIFTSPAAYTSAYTHKHMNAMVKLSFTVRMSSFLSSVAERFQPCRLAAIFCSASRFKHVSAPRVASHDAVYCALVAFTVEIEHVGAMFPH
jgi:hypothetical protein